MPSILDRKKPQTGLHLSFIGVGMYRLLRRVTGSYPAGGVCGIVFLLCYILMIGMTVSAMRALIMFLFRVGADMTGRHYDSPTALSAAAVTVLLWRPLSIYDGGFWLSFGAVLAIIIIFPIFKSLPLQSLMASFSIQLLLIPISLYYFYEIPLYGVLLNLLVIPLLTVLLAAGLAGSFVSLLFLPAGSLILGGCRWIFRLYEWSAKITLTLPGARIVTGQPKLWKVILYYGFLAAAWMIWRKKSKVPKSIAVFLLGAGLCALTVRPNISKSVQVTFLDVGQGDAVFLQGTDGTTCLVDGGSSDVSKVGEYRIEPYLLWRGVNRLDHIFVTHGDTDHINGIEELIKRQKVGVKIGRLVLPDRKVWDEKLRALAVLAQEEGIPVAEMKAADLLRSGELTLTCIQPDEDGTTPPGNASSMVLAVQYREFDLLLTGDVEEEGEERLIKNLEEQYPDTTWEVLKTAHHGSRNSTTEEFLESVSPAYAIISAGVENRYGHPHPKTLERLKKAKSKVYSTQDNGAVTITVEDEKMTAEGHL